MNARGHGTAQERRVDRAWHLIVEALGSVKTIYRSAWSMTPREENAVHVFLDATVSVIAPVAIVWAALDTHIIYSKFPDFLNVMLVVVPPVLFVPACYALKKHAKDAPLLAFAVLLFSSGALFTVNELVEHTRKDTVRCVKECIDTKKADCILGPPGCIPERSRNPPWGDFLLAFSAFCVMIEEFSLYGVYRALSRRVEKVRGLAEEAQGLTEDATKSHNKLIELTKNTAEKYRELTELNEQANKLYSNMTRQAEEWNESRRAVLLKACGLVAIIVLAFTAVCSRV